MSALFPYLTIGLAFFVIAVSPGPANIANALVAMHRGARASLLFGAGLTLGTALWGPVAATGMGAILQGSVHLLIALKICGGLYLLWMAWGAAGSALAPAAMPATPQTPDHRRLFLRGVMLNLSNPKTVIAWMAALAVGLRPEDGVAAVTGGIAACVIATVLSNLAYTALFSRPGMMALYRRARRWVDGAVAGLFALAGLSLIRSGLSR